VPAAPTRIKQTRTEALDRSRSIDLQKAAQYLDVSIDFLRKRIADGTLPAYKLGYRTIRVYVRDLDAIKKPITPGSIDIAEIDAEDDIAEIDMEDNTSQRRRNVRQLGAARALTTDT
jgi:excisionase family DNA binding protein